MKQVLIIVCVVLLFSTCMTTKSSIETDNTLGRKPEFRLQAGINNGGIVENTNLDEVGEVEVDAFSGATKLGSNVSGRVLFPIGENKIETGLDYMYNNQTFTYKDNLNGFNGERELKTSQIMLPLTYDIGLFKKKKTEGAFQLKMGGMIQYNIFNISDSHEGLPKYSTNSFSYGLTVGVASTPFEFNNGTKLGWFLEMYRGTQIYEDFYNKSSFNMPGSSFAKIGLIYQFK